MSKKKKTVGEEALKLQQKDEKINPIELQRAIHKGHKNEDSFEYQIYLTLERGKKETDGDFYVVVLFKKERLLQNVIRQYFFYRLSCPTPEFDQIVYKYHRKDDRLDFMWVIPDQTHVMHLAEIEHQIDPEQLQLIQFIKDFKSGKLDQLSARENNEIIA